MNDKAVYRTAPATPGLLKTPGKTGFWTFKTSKSHCWFKSYNDFAELGAVCLLKELHQ